MLGEMSVIDGCDSDDGMDAAILEVDESLDIDGFGGAACGSLISAGPLAGAMRPDSADVPDDVGVGVSGVSRVSEGCSGRGVGAPVGEEEECDALPEAEHDDDGDTADVDKVESLVVRMPSVGGGADGLSQVVEGDGGGGRGLTLEGAAEQVEAAMQERERERERELRAEWRRREDAAVVCQRVCRYVDPGGGVPCLARVLRWTRQHILHKMCCRVVCTNPKLETLNPAPCTLHHVP